MTLNDSRGGDTFCRPRVGVEGGKGGTNYFLRKLEKERKKRKFFSTKTGQLFTSKTTKNCKNGNFAPFSWPYFLKEPDFRFYGRG